MGSWLLEIVKTFHFVSKTLVLKIKGRQSQVLAARWPAIHHASHHMSQGLGEKTKSTNKTKTSHYSHWGLKVKPLWDFAPSHDVLYWCYLKEGVSGGFCLFFKKWENHMWFHLTDWTKLNTKLQNITKIIKISEYYADYIYIWLTLEL